MVRRDRESGAEKNPSVPPLPADERSSRPYPQEGFLPTTSGGLAATFKKDDYFFFAGFFFAGAFFAGAFLVLQPHVLHIFLFSFH